jgi:parallel beta-helix repeat protein
VVTNDALTPGTGGYIINAPSVGFVGQPGVIINGPAAGGISNVVSADGSVSASDFLWIEGVVDATGDHTGILLAHAGFSELRNVSLYNGNTMGIYLSAFSNSTVSDVTVSGTGSYGIYISSSDNNTLSEVSVSDVGTSGVRLLSSSNNTLSGVTVSNGGDGVFLDGSDNNIISDVTSSDSTFSGVRFSSSSNNTLSGVTALNNTNYGVNLDSSSGNTISNITAANSQAGVSTYLSSNNSFSGITASINTWGVILVSSSGNALSGIASSNNNYGIFLMEGSANNTLYGITASNNLLVGVWVEESMNNVFSAVTSANNGSYGVYLNTSPDNTLAGVTATNSTFYGVYLYLSPDNTLYGTAAAHNTWFGVDLGSSSNNYFTGLLKVGNNGVENCYVNGGTNPGLVNSTCTETGLDGSNTYGFGNISDATLTNSVSMASSFEAEVSTDDTANTSDTGGIAVYPADPAIFDWVNFENSFRGWGIDNSPDFPDAVNQGQWTSGDGCIWDWSLLSPDTVIRDALTLPSGNDTLTHIWNGTPASSDDAGCDAMVQGSVWNASDSVCETTFLKNAAEIQNDGLGNENTLCETDETCLFMPNIASYQGHGALISVGTIGSSLTILENITLMRHTTNGY